MGFCFGEKKKSGFGCVFFGFGLSLRFCLCLSLPLCLSLSPSLSLSLSTSFSLFLSLCLSRMAMPILPAWIGQMKLTRKASRALFLGCRENEKRDSFSPFFFLQARSWRAGESIRCASSSPIGGGNSCAGVALSESGLPLLLLWWWCRAAVAVVAVGPAVVAVV